MCFTRLILLITFNTYLSLSKPASRHIQTEWVQYFDQGAQGPGSYVFGYDIEDSETDNLQFRHEQSDGNGTVVGSYGLLEPDGNLRIVHYVSDQLGYRANIENTKRKNEAFPYPVLYKDEILQFNSMREDENSRSEVAKKSPVLQAAVQNLPLFGQNQIHEKHIPPSLNNNIPDGSKQGLLINKLYS